MFSKDIMENVLKHQYDPVKAHEYYLRVRKLKGRANAADAAKAHEYEAHVTGDAKKQLASDLKKNPAKMNKRRKIGSAEQKLIRAKSLASRIKDPNVKSDMLRRLAAAEHKLNSVKKRAKTPRATKATTKPKTSTKRLEEDQVPMKSKNGAKLRDFDGKTQTAVYNDGSKYTKDGWTSGGRKKGT